MCDSCDSKIYNLVHACTYIYVDETQETAVTAVTGVTPHITLPHTCHNLFSLPAIFTEDSADERSEC